MFARYSWKKLLLNIDICIAVPVREQDVANVSDMPSRRDHSRGPGRLSVLPLLQCAVEFVAFLVYFTVFSVPVFSAARIEIKLAFSRYGQAFASHL